MITALSFLPVFAFSGETGRLLRPIALTKTLVIASAALVTLTLAPALRDRLLRGRVIPEFSNPITRGLAECTNLSFTSRSAAQRSRLRRQG